MTVNIIKMSSADSMETMKWVVAASAATTGGW